MISTLIIYSNLGEARSSSNLATPDIQAGSFKSSSLKPDSDSRVAAVVTVKKDPDSASSSRTARSTVGKAATI